LGRGLETYNGVGVIDRIVQMLDSQRSQPFFLFAHFWDLHAPYTPPKHLVDPIVAPLLRHKRMSDILDEIKNHEWRNFIKVWTKGYEFAEEIAALYYGEVRFLDEQMGRLWEIMEEQGLLDNTLIILTSDHGESLLEHGIYFDHHGLYDVSVHVPMLLRYPPSLPQGRRVQGLVQHVDLFPTILEIIGQNSPVSTSGTGLLGAIQTGIADHRHVVFLEESHTVRRLAVRTDRYKYIWAPEDDFVCRYCGIPHGDREELYDLCKDPDELDNIAECHHDTCAAFLEEMGEWPQMSAEHRSPDIIGDDYDEEDREVIERHLRDLGYL
jgi:arylsulfatase A-like enzyme